MTTPAYLRPVVPNLIDPHSLPLPDPTVLGGARGVVRRAVPYAVVPGHRPLLLDLHLPDRATGVPVILFLHGGGWYFGDRTTFCPTWSDWAPTPFEQLVDAGFAIASVDYRLSGEATFPAQLDDVEAALDWLGARADSVGIDPRRIVLWGESAGAHLAALAALDTTARGTAPDRRIAGVVDWYGPADLLTSLGAGDPGSREALLLGRAPDTDPDAARSASPTARVHPGAPPFHIAHGLADRFVPATQSRELAAALAAVGVEVELDLVEDADHLWIGAANPHAVFRRALDFAVATTSRSAPGPPGRVAARSDDQEENP